MFELVVDEGDVEAVRVQELGQLRHRGDVALRWVRDHHPTSTYGWRSFGPVSSWRRWVTRN